jgi:hypothetical protein
VDVGEQGDAHARNKHGPGPEGQASNARA